MTSVDKVKSICKERKIPVSRLERDLGYANGYIGQLRKGTFPDDRLVEIAAYLEVTTTYLTGEDENKKSPAPKSAELIPGYSDLTEDNKAKVRDYIALLAMSERND